MNQPAQPNADIRTIVITGASDGIGAAAARLLAGPTANLVLVGRSPSKTAAVAEAIGADYFVADFSQLAQVRTLAADLLAKYPKIDVLANNAGGVMGKRQETVDGHELTFQVNHLAPFLLTTLLLDRLLESHATVINTSSVANQMGKLNINDLDADQRYSSNRAYGNAKLANILFTRELNERFGPAGSERADTTGGFVNTAAFHPGAVATNFSVESSSVFRVMYGTFLKRFLLSAAEGAETLVWLATAQPGTDWATGEYYSKRALAKANKQAYDPQLADELWQRSAAMVGKA